jgi:hypothetical protein
MRLLAETQPPEELRGRVVLDVGHGPDSVFAQRVERVSEHARQCFGGETAALVPGERVIPNPTCRWSSCGKWMPQSPTNSPDSARVRPNWSQDPGTPNGVRSCPAMSAAASSAPNNFHDW